MPETVGQEYSIKHVGKHNNTLSLAADYILQNNLALL